VQEHESTAFVMVVSDKQESGDKRDEPDQQVHSTYMMGKGSVVHADKLVDDVVMWREAGHTKCLHHTQIFKNELPCQLQ
jgi:hypothetical protein